MKYCYEDKPKHYRGKEWFGYLVEIPWAFFFAYKSRIEETFGKRGIAWRDRQIDDMTIVIRFRDRIDAIRMTCNFWQEFKDFENHYQKEPLSGYSNFNDLYPHMIKPLKIRGGGIGWYPATWTMPLRIPRPSFWSVEKPGSEINNPKVTGIDFKTATIAGGHSILTFEDLEERLKK